MFSKEEKLEILQKIGYQIVEDDQNTSRKSRFLKSAQLFYVAKDGEKMKIDEAFKREVRLRLFDV